MSALAAVVWAGAASAQDGAALAWAYLGHGMAAHESAGYARDRTVPDLAAPLSLDSPFLWPIYLREGVTYRVYAACDDNCSDLDLEIYAANGRLAGRDVARNDTPFVEITPSATGRHYVRLWLYACDARICHVAARVVARGGR
jgi:hypothetical protein